MAVDPFEVVVEVKIDFVLIFYVKACEKQPIAPKTMCAYKSGFARRDWVFEKPRRVQSCPGVPVLSFLTTSEPLGSSVVLLKP